MNTLHKLSLASSLLAGFAISAHASVIVNTPTNGAQVTSPFNLSASASTCSSQTVVSMGYSIDSSSNTTIVYSQSVNASVVSPTGAHTLHVKSWGHQGASCVTDVSLNVQEAKALVPSNSDSVSSIQALSSWKESNDSATSGSSTGTMSVVNSPSMSGNARKFVTNFSNYGGERYYVSFNDDTSATNFLYDAWVYVAANSAIANLEMDLNQVMSNGETVIYGFQCDGWSNTWDYTENSGTPTHPTDKWVHSSAKCNPRNWSANAWHHIQISYSRDDSGKVTYKSVTFDGAESAINATVPSAFALGWGQTLLTNFQVDGSSTNGSATVYLDNLTITRW